MTEYEYCLHVVEAIHELHSIFHDNEKVVWWLATRNPNFGLMRPIELFQKGRGHKVLKFIRTAKLETER